MNVHFIAIGGSAMHNMAIAMHKKGFKVTGSDDEILEPSKSRLAACGLLPASEGWFPEKINELIKEHAGTEKILDFEGSRIEGLKRFYKGFGGVERSYYLIKKCRPKFRK